MSSYHSYQDEELTTAVNQADFGAYAELVDRKKGELYRISSALTREHIRAKQLLQDTIAAVWYECRKSKDQEKDISLLFMQTLLVLDKKRQGKRRQNLSSIEEVSMEAISKETTSKETSSVEGSSMRGISMEPRDTDESPSESLPVKQMISQQSKQIEQAIDRMSASVRQVFLLTYLAEKDSSEIASYTGKTEKHVTRYLQQAMTIIAKEIGENSGDMLLSLLRKHFEDERETMRLNLAEKNWDSAVQQGLQDARKGKKPPRRTRNIAGWSISGIIAILAVTLLVLHPWTPEKIHEALNREGTLVVPDLSSMMETGEEDNLIKEKIDDGDYVELGQAMETDNGVRLILDAAMTFGEEKIFWYTLEKGKSQSIPFISKGEVMDASETDVIGKIQATNDFTSESDSSLKGMMILTKNDRSLLKSTEGALLKFVIETQEDQRNRNYSLSTPYPKLPEEEAKHVILHDSFTVEGQSFELTELIMTTEYTQVGLKPDPENRYSIDSIDSIVLEIETDDNLRGYGAFEMGFDYLLFPSIYYEEFDHLRLSMEDTLANDDPVLVVNTDNGKIVLSPKDAEDATTELSIDQSTIEDGYFTVHFPIWEGTNYSISYRYEDAAGNTFFVQDYKYSEKGRPASLKLSDFSHVQPLTFHLEFNSDTTIDSQTGTRISIPLIDSSVNTKE
ncbi:sigma-70 family RNA polymerase sigma factor [Paenibacillus polygoni]|uniref:Sigma-70 family RNA polymerase sigma factor n=1 Tax=Paenibacillus polygoni TaxID=3050112 RepID=A0ABY8X6I1_9BACL|nr:sigma-70 family RNA polymerase sigma factor [Paenibacillus polygoni]WIV19584.1 sigma-70 family RNA polymerase sigma factor [Paenibacillus polygoni]